MYFISIDGILYGKDAQGKASSKPDATPFTLVEAMNEVAACGNAKVHRTNGEVVVVDAGSTSNPWVHAPSGHRIRHRLTPWARARFRAEQRERNARLRHEPMPALFAA